MPMSDESQPAFIDIVALAGGDESHVFVDMVLNMYRLWAYGNYRDCRLIEPSGTAMPRPPGRAKLCIEDTDWRALAARENGVHRLIRLPPEDRSGTRPSWALGSRTAPTRHCQSTAAPGASRSAR